MNPNNQRIATTHEQSQVLCRLDVDPRTADMSIDVDTGKLYLEPYSTRVDKKHEIPAWSLGALLDLLPDTLNDVDIRPAYGMHYIHDCSGAIVGRAIIKASNSGCLDGILQIRCLNGLWMVDYSNRGFLGSAPADTNLLAAVVDAIILLKYNKVPLNGEPDDDEPEEPSSEQSAEEDDDLPF